MARAPTDGAIAERARTSLGLLTLEQLDALGVSRQRRRSLVARGTLVPLGRGVLCHAAPVWRSVAPQVSVSMAVVLPWSS